VSAGEVRLTGDVRGKFTELTLLEAASFDREFLVRGVLVSRQPAVIGGGKKMLKSGVGIDLAISLDTATPF